MNSLNLRLIKTLGLGWLAYGLSGMAISVALAAPTVTLLVDRSYCPDAEWQRVMARYQALYDDYSDKTLNIKTVVLFSELGEEALTVPPLPDELDDIPRYGQSTPQRQQQIKASYPNAELLSCQL